MIPTVGYSGLLPRCREVDSIPTVGYSGFLPRCREVGLTRRLFSCHGVVRSGLPDGLVFLFCHGDVRSVYRWFQNGYMVRYIVGVYGMVHS